MKAKVRNTILATLFCSMVFTPVSVSADVLSVQSIIRKLIGQSVLGVGNWENAKALSVQAASQDTPSLSALVSTSFETEEVTFVGRGASTERSTDIAHNGSYSLKITGRTSNWQGTSMDVTHLVTAGNEYEFSAWVYIPKGQLTTKLQLSVEMEAADGTKDWKQFAGGSADVTPGTWVELKGNYTFPSDFQGFNIYIESDLAGAEVPFYVDSVNFISLTDDDDAISKETTTLVASSFETDEVFFVGRGNATAERSTDVAQDGDYSIKVTGRTANWQGTSMDVTHLTAAGNEYEWSVWAYIPEGQPTTKLQLSVEMTDADGGKDYKQFAGGSANVAPETWVELKGNYVFPSAFQSFNIYIESDSAGAEVPFYIDNFTLKEFDAEKPSVDFSLAAMYEAYQDYFLIGTAIGTPELTEGLRNDLLSLHYNAITAENIMKPDAMRTAEKGFNFDVADRMVAFAKENGLAMIGHTFVWHQQSPAWLNTNEAGEPLDRESSIANMEEHISTIAGHYAGDILAWDVVNEAFIDGVTNPEDWRSALRTNSNWLNAIGSDYLEIAFRTAHAADPNAKLYYNDYNLDTPAKREAVYHMVAELRAKGVPIHGIGMQGHYNMNTNMKNVENSILRFKELPAHPEHGLNAIEISITELDIPVQSALGNRALSVEEELAQAHKYAELFEIFKRHSDSIERVTIWGLDDGTSWRGDRFPLVFTGTYSAKLAYQAIMNPDGFIVANPLPVKEINAKVIESSFGTPALGGTLDPAWETAKEIPIEYITNEIAWEGDRATGVAKTLWDNNNLYVWVQVNDSVLNDDNEATYQHDSVEVFFDELDLKTAYYDEGHSQNRVSYKNTQSFGTNGRPDGFESYARTVDGGYIVEMKIPFNFSIPSEGAIVGFDVQINDADDSKSRVAYTTWHDRTGSNWQNSESWGRLLLIK